jgi:excisionase family DNA binding protein
MDLREEFDFLTLEQAAGKLGVNRETLARWVRSKKIGAVKLPGKYLIRREALVDFLNSSTVNHG